MKLIVGLGNPGEEYRLTRHNIGFLVLEELARLNNLKFKPNRKFKALTSELVTGKGHVYLAMPQTFMNLSGHSVRAIINWLKITPDEILVVMDDISLPFGAIRMKPKGSGAGHKGLGSIIDCLGTTEFSRMRIGIRGRKNIIDLSQYVLNKFTRPEQKKIPALLSIASLASLSWAQEGINVSMNKFNKYVFKTD